MTLRYRERARIRKLPPCPHEDLHTKMPPDYIGWHEWAGRMSKHNRQKKCPGCGRWVIWVPK